MSRSILISQILSMYLLMLIGYIMYRKTMITSQGTKEFTQILLKVVLFTLVAKNIIEEFRWERIQEWGISFVFSFAIISMGILIVNLVFKKEEALEKFAANFSNSGFIGIPLISTVLGEKAIFYLIPFIMTQNILYWTYGVHLLSAGKFEIKGIFLNPPILGIIFGLMIVVLPVELPSFVIRSMQYITEINTPLAMFVLGAYLAEVPFAPYLREKAMYKVALVKLLIYPLGAMALFLVFPIPNSIKSVLLIACSTPTAASTAFFAQSFGKDYSYGAALVGVATLLSILSIPLILQLASTMGIL